MKNIYIILALSFAFVGSTVDAAIVVSEPREVVESKPLFDLQTKSINKIAGSDITRFDLGPVDITNIQNIDHWKVRLFCDKHLIVKVNSSEINNCGQAVKIMNTTNNDFSLFFKNNKNISSKLSVKLKAYDKAGKWLHTDNQNFMWK